MALRLVRLGASDVGRLQPALERFAAGARLLVIDGALWRRQLSHLTIDRALPALCRRPVERILLTQIGRTAPPHEQVERAAWDGLVSDRRG